jgi:hypothetical protein
MACVGSRAAGKGVQEAPKAAANEGMSVGAGVKAMQAVLLQWWW